MCYFPLNLNKKGVPELDEPVPEKPEGRLWENEVFRYYLFTERGEPPPPYQPFHTALRDVMENQPDWKWDPARPRTPVATELFECAQTFLALCGRDPTKLRLFCAIGSSLDTHHGIDGFFEHCGVIATVDLTANREKLESKAQVIFRKEESTHKLWRTAYKIVEYLVTRSIILK